MNDAFAELVLPIFQNLIDLQDNLSWGETPTLEEVKKRTRSWIEAAEQRASVDSSLAEDFDLARYGLVAWIDEILTDSDWGRSVDWGAEDHVLEWDLYRSHIRAEKFYDQSAIAETHNSTDPLETYLLCVVLGFRGVLGFDEEQFHKWIERVYERVSAASPVASRPFPDEADDLTRGLGPLRGPSLLVTVSILVAITAVVTLAAGLGAVHLGYQSVH
jgi:type VI secretion system protein ImpK